jgi:Cys-tRNA(Pro)/Cys-tRNA(Cys) deacylase
MTPKSAAIEYLDNKQGTYTLFIHSGPVTSLEQAARERNQQVGQVIRTIVFRIPDQDFFLVLVSGPRQIDWRALRKIIHSNRVVLATPEEVFQVTGYRIGTVSPFGIPRKLTILCDNRMINFTDVSLGSGLPGVAIVMKTAELLLHIDPYSWVEL